MIKKETVKLNDHWHDITLRTVDNVVLFVKYRKVESNYTFDVSCPTNNMTLKAYKKRAVFTVDKRHEPYSKEWEMAANELARSYAPNIYACPECTRPVAEGYVCGCGYDKGNPDEE